MKKWILPIVSGVVLIIVLLVSVVTSNSHSSALAAQQAQIQELTNQIEMKKVTAQQAKDEAQQQSTGLNTQRVETDDAIAKEFLEKAMDWDSYDTYMQTRSAIAEEYHLNENSSFLTVFFPEVTLNEAPDGTTYNIIDDGTFGMPDGLNIHYSGMTSHVTGIVNDVYSYLTEVTLTTDVANGGSAVSRCAFLYDINGDGVMSNLEAYVLS